MKKAVVLFLITALVIANFLFVPSTKAEAEEEKTIRVGWFPYAGSSEVHNGVYSGYTYDYLMEIAKYTNWTYEFIEQDIATCVEMVKNGELDLIGGLQKTEARQTVFDYPELSYGQTYNILFTNKNSPLQPYDYTNFNDITIGILSGTNNRENITQFATENDFSCEITEYSSSETLHEGLNKGEIDAAVLLSYVPTSETRVIASFSPMSIYIVTTKGNTEVLSGLNSAMNLIKINHLYFEEELYQKYYVSAESLDLTEQEQALVNGSKSKPITVGVINNCAPIAYWNARKGLCDGLAVDLFNTICNKTGLNVSYVPVEMSNIGSGKNSELPPLILGIPLVDEVKKDTSCYVSNTLLEDPLAIVGKKNTDFLWNDKKGTIAIVKDFVMSRTYIKENLPNSEIVEYPTLEECMTAVADGKADATIYFQSCIIYYLQKPYFSSLRIVPADTPAIGLCAAGFTDTSRTLLGIIDKGMNRISDSELRTITLNSTMLNTYPLTVKDIIYEYRVPLMIICVLLAAVIGVIIALYFVKRKNTTKLTVAYEQKESALSEAQKASTAKGNFMSRMSHEIRTPLNAIIGYNTIAQNELTEAKNEAERKQSEMRVMDCLSKSGIASRHLLTIINDVLDMSAIESGKINVINERFDFKGLISSLTAIFYSQAKSKGINFEVIFDDRMEEWIVGDQMRVNQILTNLLSNAVKFTPDSGSVNLSIHPTIKSDCIQLHFEIRDTGIGMSEEYLTHIWTPFEQEDSSISRRFGGTGLGLSITKTLVDLLGGSITVKSRLGEGTVFYVELTFARTEQPQQSTLYDFSTINALIVDDDQSTCDYIRLLLTRNGVRSAAVNSGEEAINAVKAALNEKKPYTVCLIDWHMPKMDGLETVKQIRSIVGKDLPIIVITAYDFSEIAVKAASLGVNRYISKPLFQSSLFNLLANISGSPIPQNYGKSTSYDFSGAHILLVEDNVMNMEIARRLLQSTKMEVDVAWNGQEALDAFLASTPGTYSAILMDVQMPVMDGYQATRAIRASTHSDALSVPIIAMTADAFAENIAESRSAGMNDHVSKPIDLPLLFKTLKNYIK